MRPARAYYSQYALFVLNTWLHMHTALHLRIIHNMNLVFNTLLHVHTAYTLVSLAIRILVFNAFAACAYSFNRAYYPQHAILCLNFHTLLHMHTALLTRTIHNTQFYI
jgi:hypothetical protein